MTSACARAIEMIMMNEDTMTNPKRVKQSI